MFRIFWEPQSLENVSNDVHLIPHHDAMHVTFTSSKLVGVRVSSQYQSRIEWLCYIISSKEMVTAMDKKLRKSESALITWFGKWSGSPCFMPSPSFKKNTGPSLTEDPKAQFSYENTNHRNTYVSFNSNWIHPPGQPPGNFFWASESRPPGQFFCLIPCPGAKNDGRISGNGAKFSRTRRNCSLSLQKPLKN